jgi:hypothetical protein
MFLSNLTLPTNLLLLNLLLTTNVKSVFTELKAFVKLSNVEVVFFRIDLKPKRIYCFQTYPIELVFVDLKVLIFTNEPVRPSAGCMPVVFPHRWDRVWGTEVGSGNPYTSRWRNRTPKSRTIRKTQSCRKVEPQSSDLQF